LQQAITPIATHFSLSVVCHLSSVTFVHFI